VSSESAQPEASIGDPLDVVDDPSSSAFSAGTHVDAIGHERYGVDLDRRWWIERGPNGGYIAAIMLRALTSAVDDTARVPRSFVTHYLSPPAEGPAQVQTTIERVGRQLSFVAAKMFQGPKLLATSSAVFAAPVVVPDEAAFNDGISPPVLLDGPPPDPLEEVPMVPGGPDIPMRHRYQTQWAIGVPPPNLGRSGELGGWIRLNPADGGYSPDHILVAALTDAWIPPIFTRIRMMVGIPTIDLTIHFRARRIETTDGWFFTRFVSRMSAEGFVEEDGEVWNTAGELVAHSRQLSMVLMPPT